MAARSLIVVALSLATTLACSEVAPEMQLVHDVAEALGGLDDVVEAQNLVMEGQGREYRLGQNHAPDGELPYWEIDRYRREVDLTNDRWQVVQSRSSTFLTGNPVLGQQQTFGVDGDVAYLVSEDGSAQRLGGAQAQGLRVQHWHHPVMLVRLAVAEGATVSNLREEEGLDVVDVTSASGETFTMHVDPETSYPAKIVSPGEHPMLGDVTLTTTFDDYQETGTLGGFRSRLTLPRRTNLLVDDTITLAHRVTLDYDQDIGDLAAPAEAVAAAPPTFTANMEVEELADGVWRLGGQSHHSVLVEFEEFLTLIEAPQHDARTLAVIEAARELSPEKPLRYLVNTHHHFDHAGGVRAAVSEGLTILTHEVNGPFFEDLVTRPHTRRPDALAGNPTPLTVELVLGDEVYEMGSGRRTLEIARIPDDEHNAGLLMAYLPRERMLVEVDAYSPGAAVMPFAPNLLDAVNAREWRVERVVPLHGEVQELGELEAAVETERNRP